MTEAQYYDLVSLIKDQHKETKEFIYKTNEVLEKRVCNMVVTLTSKVLHEFEWTDWISRGITNAMMEQINKDHLLDTVKEKFHEMFDTMNDEGELKKEFIEFANQELNASTVSMFDFMKGDDDGEDDDQ